MIVVIFLWEITTLREKLLEAFKISKKIVFKSLTLYFG